MKFKDCNILITGGASGIGKIMGRIALEKGAKCLIIWDINEQNMADTEKEFSAIGKVKCYRVDVSNSNVIHEAYISTLKDCSEVDILINNAGVVTSNKPFDKVGLNEIDLTIRINTIGPMLVAREILPDMIKRNRGHICNIASAGGMLGNPRMSEYGASKWADIGWSESVRIELQEEKSQVRITTIAPYYINTGMFNGVNSPIFPILDPEKTSAKIIRAIEKNKIFYGIPFGFHFIRFWQFLLPIKIFDFIFGKVFGLYHAMDNFVGRK
ncbi:MAG: SDR family NAD(P)-dependent oxidoreductase [Bacteroidales bacterium]|nr:SDR family NAD(P)-dependent oxidoreductase [Bacteroidales bacterium]